MTTVDKRLDVELRAELDDTGNTLYGHAWMFGTRARVPGGYEMITRSAFEDVLSRGDTDALALHNHDLGMVLGRQSSGTLRLRTDNTGLAFEVDLPDTSYGRDVREMVTRGDLTGASIGFRPDWSKSVMTRAADGLPLERHTLIEILRDISTVARPAHRGTNVNVRAEQTPEHPASQTARARARVHLGRK